MEVHVTQKERISTEIVRSTFDYNPMTGHLLHRRNRGRAKQGSRAGSLKPTGYRVVNIRGAWFQSARVAWLHYYGQWPEHQIDHINHLRDDDRIKNLRDVTPQENSHNLGSKRKNNTSGTVGVTWNAKRKKWYAAIHVMSKPIFLGGYDSYEAAVQARNEGKLEYHK